MARTRNTEGFRLNLVHSSQEAYSPQTGFQHSAPPLWAIVDARTDADSIELPLLFQKQLLLLTNFYL